jgi:hypothetical protein
MTEAETRDLALAFARKHGIGVNDPGPPLSGGSMIDFLMCVITDTELTIEGKVPLAVWRGEEVAEHRWGPR